MKLYKTQDKTSARLKTSRKLRKLPTRYRRHHEALLEYGNVILVANPERLRGDLVIFNGDFKSIGHRRATLSDRTESIKAWSQWECIDELEPELCDSARGGPRARYCICGVYLEARLYRALKPEDICEAYSSDGDESAWEALDHLRDVRRQRVSS